MKSVGNGAGEFGATQQPTTDYFEKTSQYKPRWQHIENNDIYSIYELKQKFNNSTVIERVKLFNSEKRIDFEVDVLDWDGTRNREYRLAFPVNQEKSRITYEVPFGKVTIGDDELPGAAGEWYTEDCRKARPREVLDWISSSGKEFGITFSSDVAVWDYADIKSDNSGYPVLQPVLLASRRSCHGSGNWYLQEGDHHFRFSMVSHESGWKNGYKTAKGFNMPVFSTVQKQGSPDAGLEESGSFLNISKENILLGTLKKAEDSDNAVLRIYETEGKGTPVQIDWMSDHKGLLPVNMIEENINATVLEKNKVNIGKYSIETFKIIK